MPLCFLRCCGYAGSSAEQKGFPQNSKAWKLEVRTRSGLSGSWSKYIRGGLHFKDACLVQVSVSDVGNNSKVSFELHKGVTRLIILLHSKITINVVKLADKQHSVLSRMGCSCTSVFSCVIVKALQECYIIKLLHAHGVQSA